MSRALWVAEYAVRSALDRHVALDHHWRAAAACLALALLRLNPWRKP